MHETIESIKWSNKKKFFIIFAKENVALWSEQCVCVTRDSRFVHEKDERVRATHLKTVVCTVQFNGMYDMMSDMAECAQTECMQLLSVSFL